MKVSSYSIGRPLDGHVPTIGRFRRGTGVVRGSSMQYGTTLSCECGWRGPRNNEAPSQGGRSVAQADYSLHVYDVLGETPPAWASQARSVFALADESTYWDRWIARHGMHRR